jgi:hypothetical protein
LSGPGPGPDADGWASRIERALVRIIAVTRLDDGPDRRRPARWTAEPPVSRSRVEYLTPAMENDRRIFFLTGHHRLRPRHRLAD